jgi:hypothetical protein
MLHRLKAVASSKAEASVRGLRSPWCRRQVVLPLTPRQPGSLWIRAGLRLASFWSRLGGTSNCGVDAGGLYTFRSCSGEAEMSQEIAPIRLDFRSQRSVHVGRNTVAMNRDMPARTVIHIQQHVTFTHPRSPSRTLEANNASLSPPSGVSRHPICSNRSGE